MRFTSCQNYVEIQKYYQEVMDYLRNLNREDFRYENNDYRDNTVFDIKKRKNTKWVEQIKDIILQESKYKTNKKIRLKNITK